MWLGIIVATSLWGVAPLFQRMYADKLSLATIGFVFVAMIVVVAPVVFFFSRGTLRRELPALFKRDRRMIGYMFWSLVVGIVAFGSYLWAMRRSNNKANVVVALTGIYPLVTALLLCVLHNEAIAPKGWLGIALIVAGAALLVGGSAPLRRGY